MFSLDGTEIDEIDEIVVVGDYRRILSNRGQFFLVWEVLKENTQ